MANQGRPSERLLERATAPALGLWVLAVALGAGTAVMSVEAGAVQWDGVVATAVVVLVIGFVSWRRGRRARSW